MEILIFQKQASRLDGSITFETWLSWNGKRERLASVRHRKQSKSSESKNALQEKPKQATKQASTEEEGREQEEHQDNTRLQLRGRAEKEQEGREQQEHQDNTRLQLRGRAPRPRSAV